MEDLNFIEMLADEDETEVSPCLHGNTVIGHSCYCHHPSPKAPRKCPIWRQHGNWLPEWSTKNCKMFKKNLEYK